MAMNEVDEDDDLTVMQCNAVQSNALPVDDDLTAMHYLSPISSTTCTI